MIKVVFPEETEMTLFSYPVKDGNQALVLILALCHDEDDILIIKGFLG